MNEQLFNTILKNSIEFSGGWAHKISDPLGGLGSQNPFDIFGVIDNVPIYCESKFIKGLYAFNFNRIEDHQWENLCLIKKELPLSHCLVSVGFYKPRKFFYAIFFDIDTLCEMKENGRISIKKKELENYISEGKAFEIVTESIGNKKKKIIKNIGDLRFRIV